MKKVFLLMLISVIVLSAGCGGTQTATEPTKNEQPASNGPKAQEFTFGAATQGGFWYALSGAMADEIQKAIPGSTTTVIEGGSIANLLGLEDNKFQIGFSNGESVPNALNGVGKFEKKAENIRFIATLYPNIFQMVVRADSNIYTIEDLKGKRISPGIKGYSGELIFQDILRHHGMSYEDLSKVEYVGTADGANLLQDGHIDAIVGMVAVPLATFQELDTTIGIRLLTVPNETIAKMHEENEGISSFTIKSGTYSNFKEDAITVAANTVLLVNKNLDDETVYALTKMVIENAEKWKALNVIMKDFDAKYSIENQVGPIHPGAEKYYREIGVIK